MLQQLFKHIDSLHELALELQTGLTARPAIGPGDGGDGELARAEYLAKTLDRLGFPSIQWIKAPDDRVNCGFRPNLSNLLGLTLVMKRLLHFQHSLESRPGILQEFIGNNSLFFKEKGFLLNTCETP